MPAPLEPIEVCEEILYIWDYFISMSNRRTATAMGDENPISNLEILSWSNLHGVPISSFEAGVLDRLEVMYFRTKAK